MKKLISIASVMLCAQVSMAQVYISLPYERMGWTPEEAAAHFLNRFAYGPKVGQIEKLAPDLENWVSQQIYSEHKETDFISNLNENYPALLLGMEEIGQTYPAPGVRLLFMGMHRDQNNKSKRPNFAQRGNQRMGQGMNRLDSTAGNRQEELYKRVVNGEKNTNQRYAMFQQFSERRFGWLDFEDLLYQTMAQKLERAIYSENQLEEIMVDFWFNHFNVSLHGVNDIATHVLSYERDVIRPHALGNFRDLLGATAKHPAMLRYLDNNRSNAEEDRKTLVEASPNQTAFMNRQLEKNPVFKQFAQQPGVNENYPRELMELHTLGVDGCYDQKDVEEVARAFTGWKVSPWIYPIPENLKRQLESSIPKNTSRHIQEGFLFDPTRHDAEPKVILGSTFPEGGGVEEGELILDQLAEHPNTASFISEKLAIKFVSDNPPSSLVEKMAATFLESEGDIKSVLITMMESEEFWNKEHYAQKIKTPVELVASTIRAVNGSVTNYRPLIKWCNEMGQPLYAYQAPTGYPETSEFWVNGSALLNRMNFGTGIAVGLNQAVNVDLEALNNNRMPESEKEALEVYLQLLLPERNTKETYDILLPILSDPTFNNKINMESRNPSSASQNTLEQVVGLIIGSPEFQRQ
ncbi:MAG: DUF1800 domain-containing protein [Bacteroidota bacterium]